LTATTLILLTFTVLSFTSVKTSLQFYRLPTDRSPPYQGALLRDRHWKGLQRTVEEYVTSAFSDRGLLARRSWLIAQTMGERAYIDFVNPANGRSSFANGLLGMDPEEPAVTGIDRLLVGGRWFQAKERSVCILPDDLATLVGIAPQDAGRAAVRMLGRVFTVIGIIDARAFNRMVDLDGEKVTPVDTVLEITKIERGTAEDPRLLASAPIEGMIHLESNNVVILPHEYLIGIDGTLRSIALVPKIRDGEAFIQVVERFMQRVALTMFVTDGGRVVIYSSVGATTVSGLKGIIVPVVIAALIVLNVMMGSVYERFREIGIYSSVGLAPSHVAALFMAEAAVFATVGAVVGYLIGQVMMLLLAQQGLLGGMSLNYSSLSAVSATLIVMGTVFLSTLYPTKKAASMAVPDVTRRWEFPPPDGDVWRFDFPFTVGRVEISGMAVYLKQIFESYGEGSIGDFVTQEVTLTTGGWSGEPEFQISTMVWLAPYDLGVSQEVHLDLISTGEHRIYKIEMTIIRRSGEVAAWQRSNRRFLHALRKRFLVWRTIPAGIKEEYQTAGEGMLTERGGQQHR
jgi:hypothetical protein